MFLLIAVCRRPYTEICRHIRETHLKMFPGDTFTRQKHGNVDIKCSSFLGSYHILTIRSLFCMSYQCSHTFCVGDYFIVVEQQV